MENIKFRDATLAKSDKSELVDGGLWWSKSRRSFTKFHILEVVGDVQELCEDCGDMRECAPYVTNDRLFVEVTGHLVGQNGCGLECGVYEGDRVKLRNLF